MALERKGEKIISKTFLEKEIIINFHKNDNIFTKMTIFFEPIISELGLEKRENGNTY
jgi:hypothetical protein